MENNNILVIDGTNLINRNYFVHKNRVTSDGVYTGGLYGLIRSLRSYENNFSPLQMFVCFDKGKNTFRHKMYEDYKGTRKKTDENLKSQFALLEEFLGLANIPFIEMDLYEADDIIGSLCCKAKEYNLNPYAISGDKDLFQLLNHDINIYYLSHKGPVIYDKDNFMEEYGIDCTKFLDYKALVGDSSDNIPGIKGIGKKTAENLLNQYGSLTEIYSNVESLKGKQKERIMEGKSHAYLSRELSLLKCDIELSYEEYFVKFINEGYSLKSPKVNEFLNKLEI